MASSRIPPNLPAFYPEIFFLIQILPSSERLHQDHRAILYFTLIL